MASGTDFAGAVARTLDLRGTSVLGNDRAFRATLSDLADPDSDEMRAMAAFCDQRFLSFFSAAAASGDPAALRDAAGRAASYAAKSRFADESRVLPVAMAVAEGVWAHSHPGVAWPSDDAGRHAGTGTGTTTKSRSGGGTRSVTKPRSPTETGNAGGPANGTKTGVSQAPANPGKIKKGGRSVGLLLVAVAVLALFFWNLGRRIDVTYYITDDYDGVVLKQWPGDTVKTVPAGLEDSDFVYTGPDYMVPEGESAPKTSVDPYTGPEIPHYRFAGWAATRGGEDVTRSKTYGDLMADKEPGYSNLSIGNELTLYALWTPRPMTVNIRYDWDQNSMDLDSIETYQVDDVANQSVIMPAVALILDGYTLVGWTTDRSQSPYGTAEYSMGESVSFAALSDDDEVTLYPVYSPA